MADPTNPAAGAAVLGISAPVLEEHYNRGGQAEAALQLQALLRAERSRTEPLARRAFAEHADRNLGDSDILVSSDSVPGAP